MGDIADDLCRRGFDKEESVQCDHPALKRYGL